MVSDRLDARDAPWPTRPWVMAVIGMTAGWLFYLCVDYADSNNNDMKAAVAATFIAVAAVSFIMTVEVRRWLWALGFALAWGLVIGLVAYSAQGYNVEPTLFEWPFLASIFAVLLAAPLFQAARDEGGWRFPPMLVQMHAWTDAVIGAAAFAFVGISFALYGLIAGLFNLIGITFLLDMFEHGWFIMMLAGFAFGAGVGLLRERDALVATMQRLVRIVLGVLAPVLAFALTMFLISLPLTGLSGLWDGWVSAAALTLLAGAGAYVLINAVIGPDSDADGTGTDGTGADGSDSSVNGKGPHTVLRWSALVLALVVLPLALLADSALLLRVGQYGWTPERIWGVICALIATAFGIAGWWAVIARRDGYAPLLRTLETRLAVGVCGIALILSLPIIDFGAISARDQLARLRSGEVKPADFDWAAMAFDFGPSGRDALRAIARSGPRDQRALADEALKADGRYALSNGDEGRVEPTAVRASLVVQPAGRAVPDAVLSQIGRVDICGSGKCVVHWLDERRFLLIGKRDEGSDPQVVLFSRDDNGASWSTDFIGSGDPDVPGDVAEASITVRPVTRQQLLINGKPASQVFE